MTAIPFNRLPKNIQNQIISKYGAAIKNVVQKSAVNNGSPYAEKLGTALEEKFPGRVKREYRPCEKRRFRVDFAFPKEKVAIEFDGYRSHGFSKKGFALGLERQNALACDGWVFLRYTVQDVSKKLDEVMVQISELLENRSGQK